MSADQDKSHKEHRWFVIAVLVVIVAVFVVFSGGLVNEFVDWDDNYVLVNNTNYRGFSAAHLAWMFTTGFAGHYQPLSWLSYAIDHAVWGLNPFGFHLTNLILHITTSVLFLFVCRRLICRAWSEISSRALLVGSMAAVILFAVHPLRVESVSWATERRDVLSGMWLMATLLFYLRATDQPGDSRRYWSLGFALACYVLSLLSKASGMSLPLVLLAIDVYPLRRFSLWGKSSANASEAFHRAGRFAVGVDAGESSAEKSVGDSIRCIVAEKVLFLVPALIFAPLALWAQRETGALRSFEEHSLLLRVSKAFFGIVFYLWKTIWPAGLIPLYEQRPGATPFEWQFVISAVVAMGITALVWNKRRQWPGVLVCWVVYLLWLAPVLGFAQSGPQVVADRYSYLACMSWSVLIGGWTAGRFGAWPDRQNGQQRFTVTLGLLIIGALGLLTRWQTGIWRDSYTLWKTVVERSPDTPTAHSNLSVLYNERGEYQLARESARRALEVLPGNRTAHVSLARASMELGDLDAAEKHYRIAIAIYENIGKTDASSVVGLAMVQTKLGQFVDAEASYRRAIEMEPDSADWRFALAGLLASQGRDREAEDHLQAVLGLNPKHEEAAYRLAILRNRRGEWGGAIEVLRQAIAQVPASALLHAELAMVLATAEPTELRDSAGALSHAQKANSLSNGGSVSAREAMAVALVANGRRGEAIELLHRLLNDKSMGMSDSQRIRLEKRLADYEAGGS